MRNTPKGDRQGDLCLWARARLFDRLDGALPGMDAAALDGHVASCAACRAEWERCRAAHTALLGARASIPHPGDLRAGLYARLTAPRPRPSFSLWLFAGPALAAAALGLWILRPNDADRAQEPRQTVASRPAPQQRPAVAFAPLAESPAATDFAAVFAPAAASDHPASRSERRPRAARRNAPVRTYLASLRRSRPVFRHAPVEADPETSAPAPQSARAPEPRASSPVQVAEASSPAGSGDVSLAVCDEDRGFVAKTVEARVNDSVMIETKSAPAATLISMPAH